MKQIFTDLWQTGTEHTVPDLPEAIAHAYLLIRDEGNILFYSTGREALEPVADEEDLDRIAELGGIGHMLVGHWHEASPSVQRIKERFGATVVCHAREAAAFEKESGVAADQTFWNRQTVAGNVEAIPTPGHTVGSVCYLYRSPHERTYLFTGDTIVPNKEGWAARAFEDDPDQSTLGKSLDLLRDLEPDAVLAAGGAGDTFREIAPAEWPAAVNAVKASLN